MPWVFDLADEFHIHDTGKHSRGLSTCPKREVCRFNLIA